MKKFSWRLHFHHDETVRIWSGWKIVQWENRLKSRKEDLTSSLYPLKLRILPVDWLLVYYFLPFLFSLLLFSLSLCCWSLHNCWFCYSYQQDSWLISTSLQTFLLLPFPCRPSSWFSTNVLVGFLSNIAANLLAHSPDCRASIATSSKGLSIDWSASMNLLTYWSKVSDAPCSIFNNVLIWHFDCNWWLYVWQKGYF